MTGITVVLEQKPNPTCRQQAALSDIKSQTYFTIETDSLIPTGLYGLLDSSREGKYYVGTRQNPSQITVPYFTESKTTVLLNAMEYGRYYIAKLSDGNSIIVLIDDTLFSINKGKTIRLPVGVKASHPKLLETGVIFASYFQKNAGKYRLEETDWYVDMKNKSFHNGYRLPVMVLQWVGGFLILVVLILATLKVRQIFMKKQL